MTGFTDCISDKKKGGLEELAYLHFLAQWTQWTKCISREEKSLHIPIFVETK